MCFYNNDILYPKVQDGFQQTPNAKTSLSVQKWVEIQYLAQDRWWHGKLQNGSDETDISVAGGKQGHREAQGEQKLARGTQKLA